MHRKLKIQQQELPLKTESELEYSERIDDSCSSCSTFRDILVKIRL